MHCSCCGKITDERSLYFVLNLDGPDWLICFGCGHEYSDEELYEKMCKLEARYGFDWTRKAGS